MVASAVGNASATRGEEGPASEYAVYFLDALGFRQYVTENPVAAIGIIEDINDTVRIAVQDHGRQARDGNQDEEVRLLAERHSVTAFEYLIPFSDSIFLLSREPSRSVFQVSHLLVSALQRRLDAFANPRHDGDVRDVPVKTFNFPQGTISDDVDRWYPVLMRGGAAYGEAHALQNVVSLVEGRECHVHGVTGPAVVEAVGLEEHGKKHGKGPRIRCSPQFASQVSEEAADYVGECYDDPSALEVYWPMALFETEPESRTGLWRLVEPLHAAFRLWTQFAGDQVGLQYVGFMRLLVESARRKYADSGEDVEKFVMEQSATVCSGVQATLVRELLFG